MAQNLVKRRIVEGALKGDVRFAFFFGLLSSILPFSGIRNLGLGVGVGGTSLNKLYRQGFCSILV